MFGKQTTSTHNSLKSASHLLSIHRPNCERGSTPKWLLSVHKEQM